MVGREKKARKHFDESLSVAERQGARFEYAQTLLARGKVGREYGWAEAEQDLTEARRLLHEIGGEWVLDWEGEGREAPGARREGEKHPGEPVTLSLADRFEHVLEAGRKVASALNKEAVYAAVREAALTLLRGEDCLILEIESELQEPAENCIQNISIVSRLTSHALTSVYSHTIVQRTLEAGWPLVVSEGLPESATESVVLSEARSILCAPIKVRGQAVCCFYVTHRQVGGLFGEEEERLAAYIATLAGAALENAEGFARVEAMSRSLEQQVEERTRALSESNQELEASLENLQKAQQQLRQSDKMAAIGALVAGLSHELNNPLTAVIGFAEVLLGSALSPEARSHAECILSQGTRCAELIQRLMDFSRGSSPTIETIDLNALIRTTLDLKRYALRTDGIELQVDLQGGLPPVRVDRHQIRQVFLNLLNNAHEALMSQDGKRRLRVCTERIGEMLRVMVEDSGPGIPEGLQSRVFEPFFTTKPTGEGRGLGLSISYGILQSHGGEINFDSREAEGTRFWFVLPIRTEK